MGAKRRARRSSSEDSEELGSNGVMKPKPAKTAPPPPLPEDDGSEEEEQSTEPAEEKVYKSDNARPVRHAPVAAASKPKETPERAKKPSPAPAPEDVGARGSGEASPVRDAPTDDLAVAAPPPRKKSRTKKTTKRVKRPPPPSEEEEERAHDEVEESGDPSLVSKVPADETAAVSPRREIVASPDHNKRGATPPSPKRAKRGATPPQEVEEQAEKRAAGAGGDGTGEPQAETGAPADKVKRKKKKNKKLRKVLVKPHQPDPSEFGLTGNIEEAPDARNTTSPQEDSTQEEEQQGEEMVEQDLACNTTSPQEDSAQVAEQEHSDNTSLPQQQDSTQDDNNTGVDVSGEALPERNASSPKLCTSDGEKKPAVEQSWSREDELKILTALVEHAQSHGGALPDSSDLLANLTFDKTDANADKLDDKIRKLRARYRRLSSKSQGRPTDDLGHQLFELSEVLWGQVGDDVQTEATFVTGDREFSQRSSLYPYLAQEVKVYAETHSSGDLITAAFTTISDDKARRLNAMCRKQRVDAFNLELSQTNLTKAVLSAFSSQIN